MNGITIEVKIVKEDENPLLKRRQIKFEVDHPSAPTPSRANVLKELSSFLDVPKDRVVIAKMTTPTGNFKASGVARVYDSRDHLKEWEPENLIERGEATEGRAERAEGAPEEAEEKPETEERPETEEKSEELA